MSRLTRRGFLQGAVAASSAFSLFTVAGTRASGKVLGANDTIRVGVAGINGRGRSHIDEFLKMDNVEVAYLIDPDSRLFGGLSKQCVDAKKVEPKCVQDVRVALEDKNLDAISVATCNHWHSLITIWACQAGKHVYVEKPISHNVFEGRKCVEASQRYGRVVQHGTQQRSDANRAQSDGGHSVGQVREAAGVKGLLLQTALVDRHQAGRTATRVTSISTSGWVRHPSSRSTAIFIPTTGTGSGTSAMGTPAIKGSTKWTSHDGPSRTRHCRTKSGAWAVAFSQTGQTKAKRPTCNYRCTSSATRCSCSRRVAWSRRATRLPSKWPTSFTPRKESSGKTPGKRTASPAAHGVSIRRTVAPRSC